MSRLTQFVAAHRRWLLPVLVVVISASAYLNTLRCGFTFDDRWLILDNSRIDDPSYITYMLFKRPLWRPVKRLTLMLDYAVWGRERPAGFHATNIAINSAACLAVYFLLRRIGARSRVAFLGSLVFALHPVHVEAVANICHRKEPLSLLFQILGFLAYLKARSDPPPWTLGRFVLTRWNHFRAAPPTGEQVPGSAGTTLARLEWLFLAAVCYLLGLLSKEVGAVMLPAMILVYELALGRGAIRQRLRFLTVTLGSAVLVFAGFIYKGHLGSIIYRFSADGISFVTNSESTSYGDLLLRDIKAHTMSIGVLFWPWTLYLDRHFIAPTSVADPYVIVGLLLFVLYGVLLRYSYRRSRLAFFALCWYGVNYIPVSNVVPLTHWPFAERFLYVPSVGFALLVALGLDRLLDGRVARFQPGVVRGFGMVLTGSLLLFYGARTVRQNEVWRSERTLWAHTLKYNPDSFRGLYIIGREKVDGREFAEAERMFRHCLDANPGYDQCRRYLQLVLVMQGRSQEALERAIAYSEQHPRDAAALAQLGQARFFLGDLQGAEDANKQALVIDPEQQEALRGMAQFALLGGRFGEAVEFAERVFADKSDIDTQRIHAQALTNLGRLDEAIASYRHALVLDAKATGVAMPLARLLAKQGDVAAAIAVLEQSIAIDTSRNADKQLLDSMK